jgi:hypothetical protein
VTFVFTLIIVVHLTNVAGTPASIVREAQATVVTMFRSVGVTIVWAPESPWASGHPHVVRLTLVRDETEPLRRRYDRIALGAATRTAGGTGVAWVFYRRVQDEAGRYFVPVVKVLACVMAHELGHLLQPRVGHTDAGVMRATWTPVDYRRAARDRLQFTAKDREQFVQPHPQPASHREIVQR